MPISDLKSSTYGAGRIAALKAGRAAALNANLLIIDILEYNN